ncbi:hypothetical protein F4804DRAFT_315234 [Jackrogersella minutella]|nr:hypothetical protein F4804DRAFT_315234 [Jackrogersella minutella]
MTSQDSKKFCYLNLQTLFHQAFVKFLPPERSSPDIHRLSTTFLHVYSVSCNILWYNVGIPQLQARFEKENIVMQVTEDSIGQMASSTAEETDDQSGGNDGDNKGENNGHDEEGYDGDDEEEGYNHAGDDNSNDEEIQDVTDSLDDMEDCKCLLGAWEHAAGLSPYQIHEGKTKSTNKRAVWRRRFEGTATESEARKRSPLCQPPLVQGPTFDPAAFQNLLMSETEK